MFWQTAQTMTAEPILITSSLAITGGVGIWFARTLMEVRDSTRALKMAIYGDPEDPNPNGVKRDVTKVRRDLEAHITEQSVVNAWTAKALGEITKAQGEAKNAT